VNGAMMGLMFVRAGRGVSMFVINLNLQELMMEQKMFGVGKIQIVSQKVLFVGVLIRRIFLME
jgi:hypothetical protein